MRTPAASRTARAVTGRPRSARSRRGGFGPFLGCPRLISSGHQRVLSKVAWIQVFPVSMLPNDIEPAWPKGAPGPSPRQGTGVRGGLGVHRLSGALRPGWEREGIERAGAPLPDAGRFPRTRARFEHLLHPGAHTALSGILGLRHVLGGDRAPGSTGARRPAPDQPRPPRSRALKGPCERVARQEDAPRPGGEEFPQVLQGMAALVVSTCTSPVLEVSRGTSMSSKRSRLSAGTRLTSSRSSIASCITRASTFSLAGVLCSAHAIDSARSPVRPETST